MKPPRSSTKKRFRRRRPGPERLGDFIRRIRHEKGLSLVDVSQQSAAFGRRISSGYINRLETDPTRKPSVVLLNALAHGLGIPVAEVLAHTIGSVHHDNDADEIRLVTRFRQLSPRRKADLLSLVQLWHAEGSPRRPRRKLGR